MNQPNPQLALALDDEDRELAILDADWLCPTCGSLARLYRRMVNGKPRFFVQCWYSRRESRYAEFRLPCSNPALPIEGASSSQAAMQAWKLYCVLTRS